MVRIGLQLFFVLLLLNSGIGTVHAAVECPQYFAFIDYNASRIPDCVQADVRMYCGGDIQITNKCTTKITVGGKTIAPGQITNGFSQANWNYHLKKGVPQKWEIKGSAKGEYLVIKGQTEDWTGLTKMQKLIKTIPESAVRLNLVILAVIAGSLFMHYRKKAGQEESPKQKFNSDKLAVTNLFTKKIPGVLKDLVKKIRK